MIAIGLGWLGLIVGCGDGGDARPAPDNRLAAGGTLLGGVRLWDLDGAPIDPLGGPPTTRVFVFIRSDCPISNRYGPELRRLAETFEPRGVRFWRVYLDREETAEAIARHQKAYDLPGPAARDPEHRLARRLGATVTPEAAVVSAEGRLLYLGRIDDRYIGPAQPRPGGPTRRELADVLEASLAGKPIPPPGGPAVGCLIADLR